MDLPVQTDHINDQQEILTRAVRQVFQIDGVTLGNTFPRKRFPLVYNAATGAPLEFVARFSGHLYSDSESSYDRLVSLLAPTPTIPLFRIENNQQVIYLISSQSIPQHGRSNPWINVGLFALTLMSVLYTGGASAAQDMKDPLQIVITILNAGWPFALAMLGILLVHEFGHYIAGRLHGLDVTLPYFIPFPTIMGTMGAFINMRSIPKNRNHLLDVGMSGPLAGLVVAIIVLWIGLKQSALDTLPVLVANGAAHFQMEGNSLLYLGMKYLAFDQLLPTPMSYHGLSMPLYWLQYFFMAQPFPSGGTDVMLSSVAWAGWCGLLVTALNLMPAGQLDGGHVMYVLFGRKWMRRFYPFLIGITILLGFLWQGWWLWAVLLYFFGKVYAEPLDQITPLSPIRRALAILTLVFFFLTFIPVPLNMY